MEIRRPEISVITEERKKVRCLALCLRNCKCLINASDCIDGGLQQILTGAREKEGSWSLGFCSNVSYGENIQ